MTECACCHRLRDLTDLLRVTDLTTGEVRYICTPSIDPRCFTLNVRDVTADAIEAA